MHAYDACVVYGCCLSRSNTPSSEYELLRQRWNERRIKRRKQPIVHSTYNRTSSINSKQFNEQQRHSNDHMSRASRWIPSVAAKPNLLAQALTPSGMWESHPSSSTVEAQHHVRCYTTCKAHNLSRVSRSTLSAVKGP